MFKGNRERGHNCKLKYITIKKISTKSKSNLTSCSTSFCEYDNLKKYAVKLKFLFILIWIICSSCHVSAIRKGRLMSPSSFTALSGDLHVQIQFNSAVSKGAGGNEESNMIRSLSTTMTTKTSDTSESSDKAFHSALLNDVSSVSYDEKQLKSMSVQNPSINEYVETQREEDITSTLVISKFIDEYDTLTEFESWKNDVTHNLNVSHGRNGKAEMVLNRKRKEIVSNIQVYPDPRQNITQISVPCQTFNRGGLYEMQIVTNLKTISVVETAEHLPGYKGHINPTVISTTLMPLGDERLRQTLDVRWPSADMFVHPVRLSTYPEGPVQVILRFPEVNCERAWLSENLPEFWLELVYCGKEQTCQKVPVISLNISKSNILYAEQVRGFPKEKSVSLSCELFGLAGTYVVQLRPMIPAPNVPTTLRYLSVDWSDKFVFNVYARSIFPCDTHTGIGVLYEYPTCILEQGDRVRVYARLRADVASLKPPTSLHYVAEQRVVKNQYSLYFNCDLFTERFVEYCFVYVSQAISGAVADVRMDCVPTLPVRDSDTGGWGPWSEWTSCSTNCLGGTRNRYRFCDSPPPRYGAKFCEGSSVQTEKCGRTLPDTWNCIYNSGNEAGLLNGNGTSLTQDIGPGCRCGCIVHLGTSNSKRIIGGTTQSCPGKSFWLIQVDEEGSIVLSLSFLRIRCVSQHIKIRDGPSLSSTLLLEIGGGNYITLPRKVHSSAPQLLVEFYAGEEIDNIAKNINNTVVIDENVGEASTICTGGFVANVEQTDKELNKITKTTLTPSRLSIKRRIFSKSKAKMTYRFTVVHFSAIIFAIIIILISFMLGAQYILRYRKYHFAVDKRRDEGSCLHTPHASLSSLNNPPTRAVSTTTLISEVIYLVKMRPKRKLRHSILRESIDAENVERETDFNDSLEQLQKKKCEDKLHSNSSIVTLCNEQNYASANCSIISGISISEDLDKLNKNGMNKIEKSPKKNSVKDTESVISSGMSSICHSPQLSSNRLSNISERYDAVTLKIRGSYLEDSANNLDSIQSCLLSRLHEDSVHRFGIRSASASLTNGCYSLGGSVISTATIRSTNPKENKEQQNRKKLLIRPDSEFSLGNQEELELDYYDYNVINAGAAPGSYLGMDPAYLIWVPPFNDVDHGNECDDNNKTPEPITDYPNETESLYAEIKIPEYGHYLSPLSNTESTKTNETSNPSLTSEDLTPLSNIDAQFRTQAISTNNINLRNYEFQHNLSNNLNQSSKQSSIYLSHHLSRDSNVESPETDRAIADIMNESYIEKETSVVKSVSDLQKFLALDDIQFADESESDFDTVSITHNAKEVKTMNVHSPKKEKYSLSEKNSRDNMTIQLPS